MQPAKKLDSLIAQVQEQAEKSLFSAHSFYLNDDLVKRFHEACKSHGVKASPTLNALLEETLREQE